jgi:GNAT superfamily N-acetyltransferase
MTDARVREATLEDFVPVMRVLEGALLDVDGGEVRERLRGRGGTVLVAEADGRVIGALVLDWRAGSDAPSAESGESSRDSERSPAGRAHVEAIAVRRSRRGSGVGRALVAAARERADRLTADFDPRVRGFYGALGFEIETRDGRLWGRIDGA